ncbi:MAG TPA: response regulator [Candidatus Angelobacter sp.]|nr:response regulator [Candidatus Angelobacter sp.]
MKLRDAAVLFVDDEPFLRESMGAWLARKAGRAFCAQHGAEALEILGANKIDLVLTDVRMPVMDGIALIEKLPKAEPRPRVILVTGYNDLEVPHAHELGVDAVVEKPIDRHELLRAMQSCLGDADRQDNGRV